MKSYWEESEYLIDPVDLYGDKDRLYGQKASCSIGFLPPEQSCVFGVSPHTGMYVRGDKLADIGKSLLAGNSIRATSRLTKTSKCTVRKLYKILLAMRSKSGKDDILCPCGQPITHQGWCVYRYKNSPKRQKFMKNWHKKKKQPPSSFYETMKGAIGILEEQKEWHKKQIDRIDSAINTIKEDEFETLRIGGEMPREGG